MKRFLPISTTRWLILLTISFTASQTTAQQVVISLGPNNDGEKEFQQLIDNLRGSALFQLNGRILDIQRKCGVDEKQLRKLRIAAKGAVAEFVGGEEKTKREQLRNYQRQAGIDPDKKDKKDKEDPTIGKEKY